jgi:hypothetical protein
MLFNIKKNHLVKDKWKTSKKEKRGEIERNKEFLKKAQQDNTKNVAGSV